ncbi:MAG TPA: FIST N-terminal domain-containing protein [Planctomycetaceae bacterium]|nr:FIST N-terminal domain-containing protein [Planctomycetaceae bacterium]
MHIATGASIRPEIADALSEAATAAAAGLRGTAADLTLVFVSHHHRDGFAELAAGLQRLLPSRCLLGCSGESIIADGREIESGPAVSVWTASLPKSELLPFRIEFEPTPDGVVCTGLPDQLADQPERVRAVILLGEPYSSAPKSVLDRLADDLPGVPVVGGMASGGGPSENNLFFGGDSVQQGAVGVALLDGPVVRTLVSQGCKPIGNTYIVTRSERNVIYELGGRPAMERLQELYPTLSAGDQKLIEQGLHVGLAMSEYQERYGRGDFLISNVMGAHRESGAILLGNLVRTGQTVQFHVRDSDTADEDLHQMLETHRQQGHAAPLGGLLFSCNGRGTRLFPGPHHDAAAIQRHLGPLPVAGLFAAGEIGPVGGRNYVHGFTASLALFEG